MFEQWNVGCNMILLAGRFGFFFFSQLLEDERYGRSCHLNGASGGLDFIFWSSGLFWVTRFEKLVLLSFGTCEFDVFVRN